MNHSFVIPGDSFDEVQNLSSFVESTSEIPNGLNLKYLQVAFTS